MSNLYYKYFHYIHETRVPAFLRFLVIWGIFRSIFLSFFSLSTSHPLFFCLSLSLLKSIVCLEFSGWSVGLCSLRSEQLQSLLAVELTDMGKGKRRWGDWEVGGGSAHRKSTKLNIKPWLPGKNGFSHGRQRRPLFVLVSAGLHFGEGIEPSSVSELYSLEQFLAIAKLN